MTEEAAGEGRRGRLRRRQGVGRTGARFPRAAEPTEEPPLDAPSAGAPAADGPPPEPGPPSAPVPAPRTHPMVGRTGARFPRPAPFDPTSGLSPEDPSPEDRPGGGGADPLPDDLVGRTGARFASRGRQHRRAAEQRAADDAAVPVQAAALRDRRRYDPSTPCPDEAPTAPLHLAELKNRAEGYEPRVSVRPYVRTRGRTRARPDLLVETLISLPSPRPPLEDPEHVVIGDLCDAAPRSVAEVAALMGIPLGVARVLIGDMADGGAVRIHPTAADGPRPGPDREVMARVLRGLHRL